MTRQLMLLFFLVIPLSAWPHGALHDQIDNASAQLDGDGRKPELYLKRGQLYLQDEKFQEAINDFRKALKLEPRLQAAHYYLAEALLAMGHGDSAEHHTRLFIQSLAPQTYGALSRGYGLLGKIYQAGNEPLNAARAYEKSLQNNLQPTPNDYLQAAEAYVKSGQEYRQQAMDLLDQGIGRLGPVVTMQEAAIALELLSARYDAALARVGTLRSQGIVEANIVFKEATIMSQAGRVADAQAYYKKALAEIERLPENQQSSRAMLKLRHAIEESMSNPENTRSASNQDRMYLGERVRQ